jgi:hypothetical protein
MQAFQLGLSRLIADPKGLKDKAIPSDRVGIFEIDRQLETGDFFLLNFFFNISLDIFTEICLICETHSNL